MSRILLATIGSLGDLHPLIAIGLELNRRGHTVRFCTSETYRSKLESLGFGFHPMRPDATPENPSSEQLIKEIMDPRTGVERLIRGLLLPRLRETYEDLLRAVSGPPPIDLLVAGELVYPAPLLSEKLGFPWASHITAPMSFFSAFDPPILPPFPNLSRMVRHFGPVANRALIQLVKRVTQNWSEPVRALRAELGLPSAQDPVYDGKFSRCLVLATFSPVLAGKQPDWPTSTVITGFTFFDGPDESNSVSCDLEKFLKAGDPPLVFTLGSSAVLDPGRFYEESAEAARLLQRRAILLIGRNSPPKQVSNKVACFGYVRFSEILPRAAAVVHQGGIGTTGQTLRAGCPMLVMPYNFDQPDNADRIARLGVGRVVSRRNYCARRVAQQLQTLLDDGRYSKNARRIGAQVQNERGAQVASDALEALLK